MTVFKGPLVTEIHQTISGYVSQVSRLYAGQQEIENEWLVGPIPTDDGKGKYLKEFSSALEFQSMTVATVH